MPTQGSARGMCWGAHPPSGVAIRAIADGEGRGQSERVQMIERHAKSCASRVRRGRRTQHARARVIPIRFVGAAPSRVAVRKDPGLSDAIAWRLKSAPYRESQRDSIIQPSVATPSRYAGSGAQRIVQP